jgi:hypothetical protein
MSTRTESKLDFTDAVRVGTPSLLAEFQRGVAEQTPEIPSSAIARGLSLKSLRVTSAWDRLWNLLGHTNQIYFLSVAFDISEKQPVLLPPKEVPSEAVYKVRAGEAISFSLGDGAPVFPPRVIVGGLIIYITVCEADRGLRHVGDVLEKVHDDFDKDGSLAKVIAGFLKNPALAAADQILAASTAALQPIATILKNNGDDYIGLFTGIYPAKGGWQGKLTATNNGTTLELSELR